MYTVKVQLDNGDVVPVDTAKLIIEIGDGVEQVHLTATREGVIVDRIFGDDVTSTRCLDPEVLTEE